MATGSKKAPPRKRIVWQRAVPIFVLMMAALFVAQYQIAPRFPGNPLLGTGSLGLSLIAGLAGAILIAAFGTEEPPKPVQGPGMSKTQRRKLERARALAAESEPEQQPGPAAWVQNLRRRFLG